MFVSFDTAVYSIFFSVFPPDSIKGSECLLEIEEEDPDDRLHSIYVFKPLMVTVLTGKNSNFFEFRGLFV